MVSRSDLKQDLDLLVKAVTEVPGVAALILFGSHAKGTADEGSDLDILVLFKDADSMRNHKRELFERVAPLGLFVQLLVRTVEEFWSRTDPFFRQEILTHGQILYLRHPVQQIFDPVAIVSFELKDLTHREKMQLVYRTNRILESGGKRMGRGCLMVGRETLPELEALLRSFGARYTITHAYLPSVGPDARISIGEG